MKINAKLGGISVVPSPESVLWLHREGTLTMVVGADTSHGHTDRDSPSVAGIVFSVDKNASRYVAITRAQLPKQEIISDLENMTLKAFEGFASYWGGNGWPTHILWYRDGISEGQFAEVAQCEIQAIQAACTKAARGRPLPKLTFIIVGKRHHFRFMPTAPSDANKTGSVKPGLVVDKDITTPVGWDFYLQSQAGILGTSRPAHYSVIYDQNGFTSDQLQTLSYALCHIYARTTRSVSIPAPVYYADVVCSNAMYHFVPDALASDASTLPDGEQRYTQTQLDDLFKQVTGQVGMRMWFM